MLYLYEYSKRRHKGLQFNHHIQSIVKSERGKRAISMNHGLINQNIPDDLINLLHTFVGDIIETEQDLINKYCFYKVCCSEYYHEWFGYGTLCTVCTDFLQKIKSDALYKHTCTKKHQQNLKTLVENIDKTNFTFDDLFEMYQDSINLKMFNHSTVQGVQNSDKTKTKIIFDRQFLYYYENKLQ